VTPDLCQGLGVMEVGAFHLFQFQDVGSSELMKADRFHPFPSFWGLIYSAQRLQLIRKRDALGRLRVVIEPATKTRDAAFLRA